MSHGLVVAIYRWRTASLKPFSYLLADRPVLANTFEHRKGNVSLPLSLFLPIQTALWHGRVPGRRTNRAATTSKTLPDAALSQHFHCGSPGIVYAIDARCPVEFVLKERRFILAFRRLWLPMRIILKASFEISKSFRSQI